MKTYRRPKQPEQLTLEEAELARAELEGRADVMLIVSHELMDMAGRLRAAAMKTISVRDKLPRK